MSKTKIELESIDYRWDINLNNIKIRSEDLEKTQKAWAEGHFVYCNIWGNDFQSLGITIYTVPCKSRSGSRDEEISGNWNNICTMLKNGEIPDEWVYKAIEIVKKNMEESL